MKSSILLPVAVAAALLGLGGGYLLHAGFGAPAASSGESASSSQGGTTLYTCGMHPEVIQDHPGTCPQCGMQLTPLEAEGESTPAAEKQDRKILYWVAPMDPSYVRDGPGKSPMGMDLVPVYEDEVKGGPTVRIDPATEQNMGIRTAPVVRGPLVHEVRAVGNVLYDERSIGVVSLKIGGYVDKLLVDETGVGVKKGDPLFEMYAPDVVQAQDELLSTKKNLDAATTDEQRKEWQSLFDHSREKLLRWDVSEDQIQEVLKRGTSQKDLVWQSPFSGIVLHKNVLEGAYYKPGEALYRIAGLDTVWVNVSIFEYEFPWVEVGQHARMDLPYYPGEVFEGTVDFIYPYLDPTTRDRKVRLVFDNPGRELLPDMYATVYIESKLSDEAVLVPGEAVLDTGTRQIVFVARGKGTFDPREVRVGLEARGGQREVVKGLVPGEQVVTSGQFLLDSESKIKEAIQKMLAGRKATAATGSPGAAAPSPSEPKPGPEPIPSETPPAPPPSAFTAPPGLVPVVGDVCPVMGGQPVPDVYVDYHGYRVFFCCSGCPPRFLAEPEKYMEKLRRMGAIPSGDGEQGAAAPAAGPNPEEAPAMDDRFRAPAGLIPIVPKECPVMGGEPDPEVYVDYKGYRIYFCCGGCPDLFLKDPKPYLEKLRGQGLKIDIHD